MMGVGAKRALGLYRSCAPRHVLAETPTGGRRSNIIHRRSTIHGNPHLCLTRLYRELAMGRQMRVGVPGTSTRLRTDQA